jgi:hypothetical protein
MQLWYWTALQAVPTFSGISNRQLVGDAAFYGEAFLQYCP